MLKGARMCSSADSVLARHPIVHSDNPSTVRIYLEQILGPHELSTENPRAIRLRSFRLHRLRLSYLSVDCDTRLILVPTRSQYLVPLPQVGHLDLSWDTQQLRISPGRGAVLPPDEPAEMRCCANSGQLIVGLDRNYLETHARSLLLQIPPAEPLQFDPVMQLEAGRTKAWYAALMQAVGSADAADAILHHPLVAADLARTLVTGLLVAQPNSYRSLLNRPAESGPPNRIDIAVMLVTAHPEENYTVAELANAAGVSVRTLEKEFQRRFGRTPISYLRRIRLERVREELTTMPRGGRVSQVAARWGFNHFGRFAEQYYKEYLEYPSDTLRHSH